MTVIIHQGVVYISNFSSCFRNLPYLIPETSSRPSVVTLSPTSMLSPNLTLQTEFQKKNFQPDVLTFCGDEGDVIDGSCSGIGCCQTAIPQGLKGFHYNFSSPRNHSHVLSFNPCSYGFLVEDGAYKFHASDLWDKNFGKTNYPVILDWTIGNQTCEQAKWIQKIMLASKIVIVQIQKMGLDICASVILVFRVILTSHTAAEILMNVRHRSLAMNLAHVIIHLEATIVHALKGSRVMAGKMEQVAVLYSSRRTVRVFPFLSLH
ncbi:hypothetical protein Gotur_027373 [Gossypium turneri]